MAYDLSGRLVVGVASSALFDLTASDAVFSQHGIDAYRSYQEEHLDDPLPPGTAFSFIRRLLSLRDLAPDDPPVEVVIMSRNSPDTGLRVMRSIAHHGLPIERAIFTQGTSPHRFMEALNMALFLSADKASVREAVDRGLPAGQVIGASRAEDDGTDELRVAFDFDGVLASDEAERVFQTQGLDSFQSHEEDRAHAPLAEGPMHRFLLGLHRLQLLEEERISRDPSYEQRVHVAVVTARSAPAHERAMATLKSWGVTVNDAFFLGGVAKAPILEALAPHIFFDDQLRHLEPAAVRTPSVHVPYGVTNRARAISPAA